MYIIKRDTANKKFFIKDFIIGRPALVIDRRLVVEDRNFKQLYDEQRYLIEDTFDFEFAKNMGNLALRRIDGMKGFLTLQSKLELKYSYNMLVSATNGNVYLDPNSLKEFCGYSEITPEVGTLVFNHGRYPHCDLSYFTDEYVGPTHLTLNEAHELAQQNNDEIQRLLLTRTPNKIIYTKGF